jgi:hypothetical protein
MANPPPDFGENRVLFDDSTNQGLPTIIGDLSALFLQNLHSQRLAAADDAGRAVIDAQAEQVRRVLSACDACEARESSIRQPLTVSRVPSEPYGANESIANVRMKNVPLFTGDETDSVNVLEWISRILNLAETMKLTFKATVNLLIQCSSKRATNFIDELRQENRTLQEIIQNLEMRYLPDDIPDECSSLVRERNENIFIFFDRLRLTAKIECKNEPDDVLRNESVENLMIENIHRILTPSVKNALEERKMNRSLFGLPSFTSRELISEVYFLEKKFKLKNSLN